MQKSKSQNSIKPLWRLLDPLDKESLIVVNGKEAPESNKQSELNKRQVSFDSSPKMKSFKMSLNTTNEPRHFLDTSSLVSSFVQKSPRDKIPDEKAGFGSAITRFPPIKASGLSPGSYQINDLRTKSSIDLNSKGYLSGFVSKNERFSYLPYLNSGPGPGQYSSVYQSSPINSPQQIGDNRHYRNLHPKLHKSPKVRPLAYKIQVPGPGNYDLNEKLVRKSVPNYRSVFNSMSLKSSCISPVGH